MMERSTRFGQRLGKRVHPSDDPRAVGEITVDMGPIAYVRWEKGGPRLVGQWFRFEDLSEATP